MADLFQEFLAVRRIVIRYSLVLVSVFIWLLAFPTDAPSYAMRMFLSVKEALLPDGVFVVALGPVSSFVAPIVVALLVALLATFPVGMAFVGRFLRPALSRKEYRILRSYALPSLILFYAGCALAYFFIIPTTFRLLYSFAEPIGVEPFFALDEFISSVFLLTLSVGVVFLLPIFMTAASRIGLIPSGFWIRHWRGAIVSAILFSAVVTPDGSGVTMAFLSVPLIALYGIGAVASVKRA